jgi:hypothetical protein
MKKTEREVLRAAAEFLHKCTATFRAAETVHVTAIGSRPVTRNVVTFDLTGHPTASTCYGWVDPSIRQQTVHLRAVLESVSVHSAQEAVRWLLLLMMAEEHG